MRPGFGNTYGREPVVSGNVERVVHGVETAARVAGAANTLFQVGRAGIAIAGRLAPLLL